MEIEARGLAQLLAGLQGARLTLVSAVLWEGDVWAAITMADGSKERAETENEIRRFIPAAG